MEPRTTCRRASVLLALLLSGSLLTTTSEAAPATSAVDQVVSLVAGSASITTVSRAVLSALPSASADFSGRKYPAKLPAEALTACLTATACVYGKTTSKRVVVLYGDSHALMWLPALVPLASTLGVKLVLLWEGMCPPGRLSVYGPSFGLPASCDTNRPKMISVIVGLHPALVILSESTQTNQAPSNTPFTVEQWRRGLVTSIQQIRSTGTKVAILEDIPAFNQAVPRCLAANLTSVERCRITYPNLQRPGLVAAEIAAASDTKSTFVPTHQFFCASAKCFPIIGSMITYVDDNHVSFTYAKYLSAVMLEELSPLLAN